MNCVHCKQENPPGSLYCKYCGEKHLLLCRQCDTVLDTDNIFCNMCGLKVEEDLAPVVESTDSKYFKIRNNCLERYTGKGIHSVILPYGIVSIGKKAFAECDAQEIILNPEVKEIGDEAFVECRQLRSITVQEGVEKIGDCAFFLCNALEEIALPASTKHIASGAFSFCRNLKQVFLPETLDYMGSHVFKSSESLQEITVPQGITTLEEGVFSGCTALEKLTIPASVTLIEESGEEGSLGMFHSCQRLTIYGEADSTAESVAQEERIPFERLS